MSYVVENITNKTVTTKFGPKPAYSIKANGDWFSVGFKKPKYNVGDTIDFKYEEGSYGKQIDDATVRVLSKGAGTPTPTVSGTPTTEPAPPPSRSFGPPQKVFPVPLMHGDRSIIRQNSLTNARELVVNMSKTGGGFSAFATLDEGAKEVIRIARMFEEYSAGDMERRAAEEGA